MFVGREKEMEILNSHYASGKFEFIAIYGRRRIGKTTLITEFCKNKKTIFFPAAETDAKNNLKMLSAAMFACTDPDMANPPSFDSLQQAFGRIAELAERERIVFVIDEFPYLAGSERSVSSVLQNMIDHRFKNTKLMLILCGSSMSFMERQVLGYESPLYGRRTAQIKLLPFRYNDIQKWFPSYTSEELALVYAVLGGVPMYLEIFSKEKTVYQNILGSVMRAGAVLLEEPSNLMKQELREPQIYNAIVTAIAAGRTRLSEISDTVGAESGSISKYIDNLISMGIVKKETPVLSENNRKTIYVIVDNFFRFWYSFVQKNMAAILSGNMPKVFNDAVVSHLPEFMGLVFEDMCKDYLAVSDSAPFTVCQTGQWWGTDPKKKAQVQIDAVALSHDRKEAIVGSCKYRSERVSPNVLYQLKEDAQAMGGKFERIYYYIFSKSGFSASLTDAAEADSSIRLVSLDELYRK